MPKRTPWSRIVEDAGVRVRVYEREPGGVIYRSVVIEGRKDRKSLGHRDRNLAVEQARALARSIAELRLAGRMGRPLSFGELRRLYLQHRGPLLSPVRRRFVEWILGLWARYLEPDGRPFRIEDLSQTHIDGYAIARRRGLLAGARERAEARPVRPGTIRNEIRVLSTVCNWATGFRIGGRPLLTFNPVRGLKTPAEPNPRRPVASRSRYERLLEVADRVDPSGRFRLMLAIAYRTGRRINAICHLRASDLLLSRDAVREATAALGLDESIADLWPQAIRWRAEHDKRGYHGIAPMSSELRREVDAYLRRNPVLGDAWLFPQRRRPGGPTSRTTAAYWLRRAEELADLPHLEHGGWHAFRRAWATARRGYPVQDVMAAGGWRNVQTLQAIYQQADPETILAVMDLRMEG